MAEGAPSAVRAPVYWLLGAAIAVIASVVLSRVGGLWMAVIGYLLSSFGAIGMLAAFRITDMTARRSAYYAPSSGIAAWQKGLAVAAVVACAVCAWPIATHMARG